MQEGHTHALEASPCFQPPQKKYGETKHPEQSYIEARQDFLVNRTKHLFANANSTHSVKVSVAADVAAGEARSISPQPRAHSRSRAISSSDKVPEVFSRLHDSAEAQRARRTALQQEWRAREDRDLPFRPQMRTRRASQSSSQSGKKEIVEDAKQLAEACMEHKSTGTSQSADIDSTTVYSRLNDDAARRRQVDRDRATQRRAPSKGKQEARVKPVPCMSPVLQRHRSGTKTATRMGSTVSTPDTATLSEVLPQWVGALGNGKVTEHSVAEQQQTSVPTFVPACPKPATAMRLQAHAEAASVFGGFVLS